MNLIIQRVRHSSGNVVDARLAANESLTSADALAVASWYQGPDPFGRIFAQFASTGIVDSDDLVLAIADAQSWDESEDGQHALEALAKFVGMRTL